MSAKKASGGGKISSTPKPTINPPGYPFKSIVGQRPSTNKPSGVAIPIVVVRNRKPKKPGPENEPGDR